MNPDFQDLQNKNHPAVLRALKRVCGLCGAVKGDYCHALTPKARIPYLVHFARAVSDSDNKSGKEPMNAQLF